MYSPVMQRKYKLLVFLPAGARYFKFHTILVLGQAGNHVA
jgi:hypothetical protein